MEQLSVNPLCTVPATQAGKKTCRCSSLPGICSSLFLKKKSSITNPQSSITALVIPRYLGARCRDKGYPAPFLVPRFFLTRSTMSPFITQRKSLIIMDTKGHKGQQNSLSFVFRLSRLSCLHCAAGTRDGFVRAFFSGIVAFVVKNL